MSGARIIFPEFRDEQSDSRYPFSDSATLKASTGFVLPRDAFFDAALYVINATAPLYIYSITTTANNVTIVLGDSASTNVATTEYNPLAPPVDGVLRLTDKYNRPVGMLLAQPDALAALGGWDKTTHFFSADSAEFVSAVTIPATEPGVRAIAVPDIGEFFTGDLWLIGKNGVVIRQDTRLPNTIRVDIVGVPLFKRLPCTDNNGAEFVEFTPKNFLQTINGCRADDFGNFAITAVPKSAADSTLRVYPESGAIKINVVGKKVL